MAETVGLDARLMRAAALLDSEPAAAARAAAEILAEHPGHATATLLLGTARRHCGDPEAGAAFEALAAAQPESALMRFELGRSLADSGRQADALSALTQVVEAQPDLAEAWRELAILHASLGDDRACDVAFARFAGLVPLEQHLVEARAALTHHRFEAAQTLLHQQLARNPRDVAAMRMLAEIQAERENYTEAERILEQCLSIAPGYSDARFDLARTFYTQQKAHPMLPLLERLLLLEPENPGYRALLASAYGLLGQNERCMRILESLIDEHPRNEKLWLQYGNALRTSGLVDKAVAAYRTGAALRPACGEAYFCLANLKTFRFRDEDVAEMQARLASRDLDDGDRLQFEFALGKALEDRSEYAESFAHYRQGNILRRSSVAYDSAVNTRLMHRAQKLYSREFFAARLGFGSEAPDPIFILGLPRAGSTLLEQILASHSMVEGTRELPDVPGLALELGVRESGGSPAFPQKIERFTREDFKALGERYLAQTEPNRSRRTPYFIDKMPSNFFHVGLIHLMLPNARIIDARRSPLACCFSNYKQHFQAGVWFTYDLKDLGYFYRDYVSLMKHFDTVLPGRIHRVYYENMIGNLEFEVRRLLDYCGLPFEESCLRFHETRRVVQTASSEQVRRPLYGESVDQWRHFEPWLGELKDALGNVVHEYAISIQAGS